VGMDEGSVVLMVVGASEITFWVWAWVWMCEYAICLWVYVCN